MLNIACEARRLIGVDIRPLFPKWYDFLRSKAPLFTMEMARERAEKIRLDSAHRQFLQRVIDEGWLHEEIGWRLALDVSLFSKCLQEGQDERKVTFTEDGLLSIVQQLNELTRQLQSRKYTFKVGDFSEYVLNTNHDLLILDPPCILAEDSSMYRDVHEFILYDMLVNTKNDFILFGYLERDGIVNLKLRQFTRYFGLKMIYLPPKERSERRSIEVMVTNI